MTRETKLPAESDGGVAMTAPSYLGSAETTPRDRVRWIATVAALEYRLSVRNRWAMSLVGAFGLFGLLLVGAEAVRPEPIRVGVVVVSLASLATYLVPLAALAFGYDSVVGAEEAGWLDVVFALPADRATVVVGAYLGRAGTLTVATLVGFAPAGVVLLGLGGTGALSPYSAFVLGAVGLGLAFLAVGVLVSTVAGTETHALGLALSVWVWFVFVHDLLALGAMAAIELPDPAVAAFVLANPAAVFRVLVIGFVGTSGSEFGPVFATTGLSASIAVAGLLLWCAVPVLLAGRLVARRRS